MPYGKCRNCIYCRTWSGKTFDARMRELKRRFSVYEEQAEELEEKEGSSLYCRRKALAYMERLDGFLRLEANRVALGELGCGEFDLDPNALIDEDEQQQ